MPELPCTTIRQTGNCVTLFFNDEKAARDFFNSHTARPRAVVEVTPAVARHHIERGCCDGTDAAGCWNRQENERRERAEQERAERQARKRDPIGGEYDGTEPSNMAPICGHVGATATWCPVCSD